LDEVSEENTRLVELIRRVAKEICHEILDEHLTDYKHKARPASKEVLDNE
jgi:hypothetical protein